MASMLDKLLAADISDPTDFPYDATSGLHQLDEALRCHICREFYDAPVTINCGHCFCSACLRSALPVHASCPSCRQPASEVHIRKNVEMETIVQAWRLARPHILNLTREDAKRKSQLNDIPSTVHSRSEHASRVGQKRRRRNSSATASEDEVIAIPSSPIQSGSFTPNNLPDTVPCPACQTDVPSQTINMHLDSDCKKYLSEFSSNATVIDAKTRQKRQWGKLLGSGGNMSNLAPKGKGKLRTPSAVPDNDVELEHLPKVAYDIHPRARVASMLAEWSLPTHGDKATLTRRHERWIILYNANVDRARQHRHTLDQLRNELRQLEEAELKTRKETVGDPVAYQKANKAAFAQLTQAARLKKPARDVASPKADFLDFEPRTIKDADVESERDMICVEDDP